MEKPNLNYIRSLSQGDLEFEAKLIAIVKEEFPLEVREYHSVVNSKEHQKASELVHKIKHKISIFGMEKGVQIANAFENQLRNESRENQVEFEDILRIIENYLITI